METCKSPRKVLDAAYALAAACLKERRRDFTGPQLFACLVLREHQKKSYRGVVALLKDCPDWCADIGLKEGARSQHALPRPPQAGQAGRGRGDARFVGPDGAEA